MGIGAGAESMSTFGMTFNKPDKAVMSPKAFDHEKASLCLMPMGITSENVAEKYGITR